MKTRGLMKMRGLRRTLGSGAAALGRAVVAWGLSGIVVARPLLVSQTFREAGRPATWSCLGGGRADYE